MDPNPKRCLGVSLDFIEIGLQGLGGIKLEARKLDKVVYSDQDQIPGVHPAPGKVNLILPTGVSGWPGKVKSQWERSHLPMPLPV